MSGRGKHHGRAKGPCIKKVCGCGATFTTRIGAGSCLECRRTAKRQARLRFLRAVEIADRGKP